MKYKMEELVPIVAELSEKYAGKESSSITYEKAEQLMAAILYCIRESGMRGEQFALQTGNLSAKKAYEIGYDNVVKKVKNAMILYHEIIETFEAYDNICLKDTILKGMPEFFKWYDAKFNPQDTILTLDYPILTDMTKYKGIDAICIYLKGILMEQIFLKHFHYSQIVTILESYNPDYKNMIDNICGIVYQAVINNAFRGKEVTKEQVMGFTNQFVSQYYDENTNLKKYLAKAVPNIVFYLNQKPS